MIFEALNLPQKKALLIARYLVETQNQGEFIYNEHLTVKISEALVSMVDLIGEYSLFSP